MCLIFITNNSTHVSSRTGTHVASTNVIGTVVASTNVIGTVVASTNVRTAHSALGAA